MNGETHPARSPEFLSRLHDGELDAAERARFEAHRAHCPECREAAAQLEEALAFFRSARPSAAAPDLSARILRRLRNASPPRRLFGQLFGIDLRWAGAFAAALLAVIIGSSIVLERESRAKRMLSESAVRIVIHQRTAVAPMAEPNERESALLPKDQPTTGKKKVAAAPPPEPPRAALKSGRKPEQPEDRPQAAAPAADESAPSAAAPLARQAPQAPARADESARRMALDKTAALEDRNAEMVQRQRFEPQGGEGGQQSAGALAPQTVQKVRLRIITSDDEGPIPEPSNAVELSLSAADHGEYTLIVRSDGTVASVRSIESKRDAAGEDGNRHASDELRKLRFPAAGRPRHLIVRIE